MKDDQKCDYIRVNRRGYVMKDYQRCKSIKFVLLGVFMS
jgi:hypothetical protein